MSKVISCRIDDNDYEVLSAYAKEFDATISWAARRALKDFVTKITKENKDGTKNYLLTESDVGTGEDGILTSGDITES
jgi:predicted transcriptional regulator